MQVNKMHFKTVVRTGVLGINYWIEVRMEREEEHLGRQMENALIIPVRKHNLVLNILQV